MGISIHALLAESDSQPCCTDTTSTISIHALLAESDINRVKRLLPSWISIHALLAESDHDSYVIMEATKVISIHALLAESDPHIHSTSPGHPGISIHALLAESDPLPRSGTVRDMYFYPRSPCGERRMRRCTVAGSCRFLSTLSLRRATCPPAGKRLR